MYLLYTFQNGLAGPHKDMSCGSLCHSSLKGMIKIDNGLWEQDICYRGKFNMHKVFVQLYTVEQNYNLLLTQISSSVSETFHFNVSLQCLKIILGGFH